MDKLSKLLSLFHPTRRDWPSIEDFQKKQEILEWCDMQPGIYKILQMHNHHPEIRCNSFLKLEDANGSSFFIWMPPPLFDAMKKRICTNFILITEETKETGNIFYDFKLC